MNTKRNSIKPLVSALFITVAFSAYGLPTYEPFTEFSNLVATTGSNLLVAAQGVPIGTNASASISDAIDLPTGGLTAPTGEPWTSLNFSGLNISNTTAGALQGLDVAIINNSTVFQASDLSSLLPSTFPGYPTGAAITTFVENPAQPLLWAKTAFVNSNSIVGNSPVLRFSQDIVRPASGSTTIYVSYLLSVAQMGQLGVGNNGRYLEFLSQSNLTAGAGTTGTYSNWFLMNNTFNASVRAPGHGLLEKTANSVYYVGPCDNSAGKDFSSSVWTGSYGAPMFVVGAYQLSSGVSDTNAMWVNPSFSSFGGPQAPTSVGSIQIDIVPGTNRPPDIAALALIDRVGNGASGGVGTNYIANLLVGTTWSYVTGGPEFTNQPVATTNITLGESISLSGLATAAAQSVSYQWQKVTAGVTNNLSDGAGTAGGTATVSGSGTSTLTLSGIGTGDVGSYQLLATANGTSYTLNSSVAVVALADPQVSTPASTNVNYGGTANFTTQVTTQNAPLKYQWFYGSTALSNGTQPDGSTVTGASGTTGAGGSFALTLTLGGVSYQDAGNYTVYVTNNISLSAASTATLTVADPYIVTPPSSPAVAAGGNATFTVAASGSPTLTYQWYENGTALSDGSTTITGSAIVSGSQTTTLILTGVEDADNGNYSCTVTGSASGQSIGSTAAKLIVQDALTLVTGPQSRTERVGDHLAFAVTVAGGGPQFQWSHNSSPITGATNNTLILTNIQTVANGTYAVTVQNASTSPQTYPATLTVVNSALLSLYSTNILVTRVGDGAQALSGATGNTLYLDQYTENGTYVSTVQVPDEATGAAYGTGSGSSAINSPALIVQGAGSDAMNEGVLTASGGNQQYLSFAGYCESYPFSGTDVTTIPNGGFWRGLATLNAFGVYSLAYTNYGLYNGGNHTIRSSVTLDGINFWTTGQAGSGGIKYVNSTVASYAAGTGVPLVTSSPAGTHVVQIVDGSLVFSDTNSSGLGALYICTNTPEPGPNGTAGATMLINEGSLPMDFAFSPDLNTLYIADGAAFAGAGAIAGGIERWDTNSAGGGYTFSYTLPVDPSQTQGAMGLAVDFSAASTWGPGVTGAVIFATTYVPATNSLVSIVDDGSGSTPTVLITAAKNNALRGVRFGPAALAPTIVTAPLSQTNFPGNNVTFSVVAAGSAPLSYQWYGPSGLIPGATNPSFTTNGITFSSAGGYYAVVSNPTGTNATSSTATLTVTAGAPTFALGALLNYTETIGDHLAWVATINGSIPITYSWYQGGTLVSSGTISNLAADDATLVLTNIQLSNAGTYKLAVTNIYGGTVNSSGGALTVTSTRQPLYPTNLVVARIGDGVQTLSGATGNTLYLDQYTINGNYVNTIQIPDEGKGAVYGTGATSSSALPSGSHSLLFAGAGADAPYEGVLTLSPNSQELTFAGYVEAYPFQGPDVSAGANGGPNWRGVAEVDAYGYYSLDYTNTGLYSEGLHQIHSAVDIDGNGTNFYSVGEAGGGTGLKYLSINNEQAGGGGIVNVCGSAAGTRVVQVVGGQMLYSDVGAATAGIYQTPELPETTAGVNLWVADTNSPTDFAVSPDESTIYIADNSTFSGTSAPFGGIQRWDGSPGNYTYSYTLGTGAGSTVGARGLTVDFSAQSMWGVGVTGAKVYAVTAETSGNRIIEITDNGASSAATTLVTAGVEQLLGGVRYGPMVVAPSLAGEPQSTNVPAGDATTLAGGGDGSGPLTYQWYFQTNGVGAFYAITGATNANYTIGHVGSGTVGNYYEIVTSPSGATAQSATASVGVAAGPAFVSESYLGAGSGFEVFFTGTAGQGYHLYSTTDLTQPLANWTLQTTGTFSGGTDNYTDPAGGTSAQEFYMLTSP